MRNVMKNVELLSPAGSYESAQAAIQNGCDAIYMAGTRFGARAYASNFDEASLQAMVHEAHAYGVKVYITLNTLIHDEELAACLDYVKYLYDCHVDALIIQDLGLLYEVRQQYPDFEVHASTQMHITNQESLRFLIQMGVKRAVLAREIPLHEIKQLAKENIELEVFVHGALCVAYSGQCLMSSMVGGRSGNRGECAQTCRMPYTLIQFDTQKEMHKEAYLLSLQDLNTWDHVEALKQAGIHSFKIEGRMKKSEYVGHITHLYRQKIDNQHYHVSAADLQKAKVLFHRGYTSGFLYEQRGSALYNPYRPNHLGITIGKVVGYANHRVRIQLSEDLFQHDGIRVLDAVEDIGFKVNYLYVKGKLASFASKGQVVEVECHTPLKTGSVVVKTSDPRVEKQIREQYEQKRRTVGITMKLVVRVGQTLMMSVADGIHTYTCHSEEIIEAAQKRATSEAEIMKQCCKVKDTIFALEEIQIDMKEEAFVPIKTINALRRLALAQLYLLRAHDMHRENIHFSLTKDVQAPIDKMMVCVSVFTKEQLEACLEQVDYIYVKDVALYREYEHFDQVILSSQRVVKTGYDKVGVIQDIGGLYACQDYVCDTPLNVYNASTCRFLEQLGAKRVSVSHELSLNQVETLVQTYLTTYEQLPHLEVVVYGRVEVMVSEHCPINACLLDNNKQNCQLCRQTTYALKDKFKNEYPMYNDEQCRMHLYDHQIRNQLHEVKTYQQMGIKAIRLDFTFEKQAEVASLIKMLKTQLINN